MPNTGSRPAVDMSQPFPVGYRRENFPEMWGWKELLNYADRSDVAVRQMRGQDREAFPEPVSVLTVTPVYLAAEVRAYFDARQRQRAVITPEIHAQIYSLRHEQGRSQQQTADLLDVSIGAVRKWEKIQP